MSQFLLIFDQTGTEMRQILMYDPQIQSPQGLQMALQDDILMQTYILDADVTVATPAMWGYQAKRDKDGNVIPSPCGGRRRIDYVLTSNDVSVVRIDNIVI